MDAPDLDIVSVCVGLLLRCQSSKFMHAVAIFHADSIIGMRWTKDRQKNSWKILQSDEVATRSYANGAAP